MHLEFSNPRCMVCDKVILPWELDICMEASAGAPFLMCVYCSVLMLGRMNVMNRLDPLVVNLRHYYCAVGSRPMFIPRNVCVFTGRSLREAADNLIRVMRPKGFYEGRRLCALCGNQTNAYFIHVVDDYKCSVCDSCSIVIVGPSSANSVYTVPAYDIHMLVLPEDPPRRMQPTCESAFLLRHNLPEVRLPDVGGSACSALMELRSMLCGHKMICTHCGTPMEKAAGYHFAAVFCETCWEKYKAANSGICRMCGEPKYRCHC